MTLNRAPAARSTEQEMPVGGSSLASLKRVVIDKFRENPHQALN